MSGQGNGLGGCSSGWGCSFAAIALFLALFLGFMSLVAGCGGMQGNSTTDTTRPNPCGEAGVCEGS